MTDLNSEIDRGYRAKHILEDELFKEAFDTIHNNLTLHWQQSIASDKEGREDAWRMLKALNEVKRFFQVAMETGKMAEQQISLVEKFKNQIRRVI